MAKKNKNSMFKPSAPVRVLKKIFNITLIAEILVMVVAVLLLVVPTFAHIYPYSVLTASMSPKIPAGSLVYVDQTLDNKLLQPNDVIAFTEQGANYPIIHRIQEVTDTGFITKGDANNATEEVPFGKVLGKEIYYVPGLGTFATAALEYKFLFVAITLGTAACMFILDAVGTRQVRKQYESVMEARLDEEIAKRAEEPSVKVPEVTEVELEDQFAKWAKENPDAAKKLLENKVGE